MTFKPGDIVIADIPDPDGNPIDHRHPAMVLRADASQAYLVGISTKFSTPLPKYWLLLPLDATTNLREPCVLKCEWVTKPMSVASLHKIGEVPTKLLSKATDLILDAINQKKAARQQAGGGHNPGSKPSS